MNTEATKIPDKKTRVEEAFRSYQTDAVRLLSRSLAGATHLAATRRGLFAVNEQEWALLAQGFFFGLTLRAGDIYAFEACDQPHSPLRHGRIVRFRVMDGAILDASVVAKGLDNGCHQIDFADDKLFVMDTYNQQITQLSSDFSVLLVYSPLSSPRQGRYSSEDPLYRHANSFLRVHNFNLLLLHNQTERTGMDSEVAAFDLDWKPVWRGFVQGQSCHGLALLEDGTLLTLDSGRGDIISAEGGLRVRVTSLFTRGLSVGTDDIAVGGSLLTNRDDRLHATGNITFLDRDYVVRKVLELPGAPMEVRRLDGRDYGLSSFVEKRAPSSASISLPKDASEAIQA